MSGFQRFISQKVYEWQRGKLRKQNKRPMSTTGIKSMPQIIGFKVEGNKVKQPTNDSNTYSRPRRRKEGQIQMKKVLGIALIALGSLLLFTKCFMSKEEPKEKEKEVAQVEQRVESYIQDFNIDVDTIHSMLKYANKYQISYAHTLAVWALESYRGESMGNIYKLLRGQKIGGDMEDFGLYQDAENRYKQFIYDIEYFPLRDKKTYTYENGWKEVRNYKGSRQHYGIDLMGVDTEPGVIEIRSITNGIVENIGWNEVGGYRVGIRSDGGAYFYYAHLNEAPHFLKKGDRVSAGDCIGTMGDTGYGEVGTRGKFPVHLHVGIAVRTSDHKEYWMNPYAVLKYLEKYGK